ncbi:MAG: mechanosensitive ion channel family protein [Marinomonas sp.]|uniref:mechanosensitive ion channel family protein n=1 Tax=unclassified Marinomonas TaxID=196814 RepID=UPI0007AF414A|nr:MULTISPECIES: mechanosensitive ion channel family protein [unclassified Marinomonas]KZM40914.1 mechanosensitive ion channel protein MscS [Marinomonas sp. SBI22]KZM42754.1 mechanosensitive ion channel protein MscS [Marinomonas sp. SBI8L]
MNWDTFINYVGLGQSQMHWLVKIAFILFITLFIHLIISKLISRILLQLKVTKNPWDKALLIAARQPIKYFIWGLGLLIISQTSNNETGAFSQTSIDALRKIGLIALITWFISRLVKRCEQILISPVKMKHPMDLTTVSAVGKLIKASLLIISALVVLQTIGVSISGILAFGGIGGIAVGFAAKDLLANFFGGLMIYLDRPFSVGDWVRSPDKEIEGTVEHIGWRQTRIRTFDKRPLYVPNATFSLISVENPSRMSHRRIYEKIGIRYDDVDALASIMDDIKAMLKTHQDIDSSQTMIVNFNEFGPSSLDFFVYTFTKTTNWIRFHEVKQDILLKIIDIIAHHNAELAFPTQTLKIQTEQNIQPEP